jgi:hypothetical protein
VKKLTRSSVLPWYFVPSFKEEIKMKKLFLMTVLFVSQFAFAQDAGQRALSKMTEVRTYINNAKSQVGYGSPAYMQINNADLAAADATELIKKAMEQTQAPKLPFVCVIVDGKSGINMGEGRSDAEARQNAEARCNGNPNCRNYTRITATPVCNRRPSMVQCTVFDGKGHTYVGQGPTEADALVQPYRQCDWYCAKYPSTRSCVQL